MENDTKSGVYEHYKGKYYQVFGEAVHSETREIFVLYKPMYELDPSDDEYGRYAVRPKAMFFEDVEVDGVTRPRFVYVGDKIPEDDNK